MKLPLPLRALWQRFHAWLFVPFLTADESAPPPPSPAAQAHRVIREALDRYRSTHASGDKPLLRVSWDAWRALTDEYRDAMVPDPSGKQKYEGCPVVVSYSSERPGMWCDALPRYVCGPHAGARAYGKGGVLEAERQVPRPSFVRDVRLESLYLARPVAAPTAAQLDALVAQPAPRIDPAVIEHWRGDDGECEVTDADRALLAELTGVTLQQGAAAEEECAEAESIIDLYRRYDHETAQAVSDIDDNESELAQEDAE